MVYEYLKEQEHSSLMAYERFIKIWENKTFYYFALEHNSFFHWKKKIEQGNLEQAFKYVDQIIDGKLSWARKVIPLKLKTIS